MTMRFAIMQLLCALLAASNVSGALSAESFPDKSIRLIVPFPPGGGNDNVARPIVARVADGLGQQIVIDNRPGAGTMIGTEIVGKSNPDGYTLLLGSIGFVVSPLLQSRPPYDPVKDFECVTQLASAPNILVTGTAFPFSTLKELVAAAKASPGKYSYASPGAGTPAHLAGEIFKAMAGIDLLHVPYKGAANYLPDIISGRVDLVFDTTTSSMPYVKAGRLKAMAIAQAKPLAELPGVPTFAEAGYPQYQTGSWYGVLAPAQTPPAVIARLHREFVKALAAPEVRDRLLALGAAPVGSTPQEFAALIRSEVARYAKVISDNRLKVE